jgi:DNA-directed RNA polymerase specialized sigma24 family protein
MQDPGKRPSKDTEIGGIHRDFPQTRWSLVMGLKGAAPETRQKALEALAGRYWKPVYFYFRHKWSKSLEDSKDLTQAFFASLCQGESLARYDPERGSFRAYLKTILQGFSANQHDAETALKRGGGRKLLALDGEALDLADPGGSGNPEALFDQALKKEVTNTALRETRLWFEKRGRLPRFLLFEEYDLVEPEVRPTYRGLADKFGLRESEVRNHLVEVRERLRMEVLRELSNLVVDRQHLEEEWKTLFLS